MRLCETTRLPALSRAACVQGLRERIEPWRRIERWRLVAQTAYEEGINFTDPQATCEGHPSTACALPMPPHFKTAAHLIMRHSVLMVASMGPPQPLEEPGSTAPGCAEAPSAVRAALAEVASTGVRVAFTVVEAASMARLLVVPTVAEAAVAFMVAEAEVRSVAEAVATLEVEVVAVAVEAITNSRRSIELGKPANQSPVFFFTPALHEAGERAKPSPVAKRLPHAHPDRDLRFRSRLESCPYRRSQHSSGC